MAAAAPASDVVVVPDPRDTTAAKILRAVAKAPLQIVLVVIGALWIVPTAGLFLTSILPASALASKGWWQIFSKPSVATWSNYDAPLPQQRLLTALKTTAYIAVWNTLLVVIIGANGPATPSRGSTSPAAIGSFVESSHSSWCRSRWR